MSSKQAAVAVNRFGLGARPGELDRAASNPRRWLLEQLEGEASEPAQFRGFLTTDEHRANYYVRYAIVGAELRAAQGKLDPVKDQAAYDKLALDIRRMLRGYVTWVAESFLLEYGARTNVALTTDAPFRERLTRFWSNHLVVPAIKQQTNLLCGAYEREVVRPHATGKFSDMLMASAKNPAMLVFLDNFVSVGANSTYGKASGKGLNENLAREILELHTMGVEGGYAQADVIELAKAITGWTTYPALEHPPYLKADKRGTRIGGFEYQADWHEPGPRKVAGKSYPEGGIEQGEAILHDLARHPSTARFLATKLARHFTSDEPSRDLVERLAQVYLANDTDLGEMGRALVETPEAWSEAQSKIKQPEEYAISCYRALGLTLGEDKVPPIGPWRFPDYDPRANLWVWLKDDPYGSLTTRDPKQFAGNAYHEKGAEIALFYADVEAMGQSPWNAPGPQGWYDRWTDWSGADSMIKRVEWSLSLATKHSDKAGDPRRFIARSLGKLASKDLETSIARAPSAEQAVGLALASPDFQRR
jgi:uncharacterized protein (DUF1800 family)